MSDTGEIGYLTGREAQERQAALNADDPCIARLHTKFADLYAARVRLMNSSRSPRLFTLKKFGLTAQTIGIAAEGAVRTDYTVARD